ncbi:16S rRNA (guanine(966)-N(2))-methyltransferase RsmD [Ammonicoccus fulvus]|uniref:16S rRNA (Guanine(966)-N(2))-methyltransferase RsmD n=1 Tax=Ammonicoccus fulvus TaxID=3138240 RepID=A0ABZ3FSI4_9ACTN
MSRIIAGSAKGRRLSTPAHSRTRPTTDRVREALFSALESWFGTDTGLQGLSFLDLYAGSGAVGLEAASRGADPVLLVEADRKTAELIRTNARTTGLRVEVRATRVEQLVAAGGSAFDVVWLDPPYDVRDDAVDDVIAALAAGDWVAGAGLIVLERSSRSPEPVWPAAVVQNWSRRYGETTLYFAELEESR